MADFKAVPMDEHEPPADYTVSPFKEKQRDRLLKRTKKDLARTIVFLNETLATQKQRGRQLKGEVEGLELANSRKQDGLNSYEVRIENLRAHRDGMKDAYMGIISMLTRKP